jgi:protein-S-isoprenylcysteine O-methyltransferase Ste14
MTRRLIKVAIFVVLSYVIPLVAHPALLFDLRIVFLMLVCMTVMLTQPEFRLSNALRNSEADGYSVIVIMVGASISQIAPVVEWAYRSNQQWSAPWIVVGTTMLLSGTAYRIWAIKTLGRLFTAPVEIQDDHELVMTGPYRYAGYARTHPPDQDPPSPSRSRAIAARILRLPFRHPSYAGAYVAMIGSSVLLRAPISIVVTAALMGVAYTYRIIREDEALRQKFAAVTVGK